jgi:transposase
VTAAQASDIAQAEALLAGHEPEVVIADKGYDKKALVEEIESRGAEAVIPTQKTRAEQRAVDPHLYRERNLAERFWSKAKQYRRVATRYDKKAANFLAFVKVAAIMVMLK